MCRRHGQGEVKKRDLKPRRSDGKRSKSDQESVRGCERAARAERVSTHLERQRAQANKHGARDALAQHQMCNSAADATSAAGVSGVLEVKLVAAASTAAAAAAASATCRRSSISFKAAASFT